jgi:hypothetical protein
VAVGGHQAAGWGGFDAPAGGVSGEHSRWESGGWGAPAAGIGRANWIRSNKDDDKPLKLILTQNGLSQNGILQYQKQNKTIYIYILYIYIYIYIYICTYVSIHILCMIELKIYLYNCLMAFPKQAIG